MSNARAWLVSLRLRTLPLALSCVGMGCFLAAGFRVFHLQTCLLTLLTAVLLQILSNLANDYGDYKTGADNEERIGPQRALQSGAISISAMRNAIIFTSILTLISGCNLLYTATNGLQIFFLFLTIGLLCIAAAIKYTMGKNPYGYSGFGDIAVFIFFGIVAVGGTFYLHAHYFQFDILLPASALGFLSAGVLNLNNMRDIENDKKAGKRTLVVRIGLANAKIYHFSLIIAALSCLIIFSLMHMESVLQLIYLGVTPLFMIHLISVMDKKSEQLDSSLKQLAIFTLILVLSFGVNTIAGV